MTQKEIAQAALSWKNEDEDNRAAIIILVNNKDKDIVATGIKGFDMYVYALSRLFKNSGLAGIAAIAALAAVREEEGNEK